MNKFKQALMHHNLTAAQWAREQGFNAYAVYRVINGYDVGARGNALAIKEALESLAAQNRLPSAHLELSSNSNV